MAVTFRRLVAVLVPVALVAASCGGDDDEAAPEPTTTTELEVLEILVTNDDGVPGPGLDVLVQGLRKLNGVKVTVVAPATNQTGAGDARTEGELTVTQTTLPSGAPATAVAGKPADAVIHAIDKMGLEPHVVVSGVNPGQNIGPFANVSGTVGAAKWAARKGVPSVAASSGAPDKFDFVELTELVTDWIEKHRNALLDGTATVQVTNINAPYCPPTGVRGPVEVPVGTDFGGRNAFASDCGSTKAPADLVDDIDAAVNGYASITIVPH